MYPNHGPNGTYYPPTTQQGTYPTAPPYPTGVTGAYTLPNSAPLYPPPTFVPNYPPPYVPSTPRYPQPGYSIQPTHPVYIQPYPPVTHHHPYPTSSHPLPPDPMLQPAFSTAHLNPGRHQ